MNYEVFEKDPVKYVRYRQAILRRLAEIWHRDLLPSRVFFDSPFSGGCTSQKSEEQKKKIDDPGSSALAETGDSHCHPRRPVDEGAEEKKDRKPRKKGRGKTRGRGKGGGVAGTTNSGTSSFYTSSSSRFFMDEEDYFRGGGGGGESEALFTDEEAFEEGRHVCVQKDQEDEEDLKDGEKRENLFFKHEHGGHSNRPQHHPSSASGSSASLTESYTWCLYGDEDCPLHGWLPGRSDETDDEEQQKKHRKRPPSSSGGEASADAGGEESSLACTGGGKEEEKKASGNRRNGQREDLTRSEGKKKRTKCLVIMVVGAGRGPLVQAALDALKEAEIPLCRVHLYAVEKNSNAVITLRSKVLHDPCEGWRRVRVIESDMREVGHLVKEKADILVSELLGSFGDNELSVECLHGAQQQLLKPRVGISIPTSYVSSLEPVSSSRLWTAIDSYGSAKHFESPYVVDFFAVYKPGVEGPKECFYFRHPDPILQPPTEEEDEEEDEGETDALLTGGEDDDERVDDARERLPRCRRSHKKKKKRNTKNRPCVSPPLTQNQLTIFRHRRTEVSWRMKTDTLVHGLAGYFHCCLYRDVYISIDPRSFSEGMFSWFPLFLPFRVPVYVRQGEELEVYLAREGDDHRVWYEWAVVRPAPSEIYNHFGKHYFIGK